MEWLFRSLPESRSVVFRYGVTAALVLVSFALRLSMDDRAGPYGFVLFLPAILGAAFVFDRGSGFVALALAIGLMSAVVDWTGGVELHLGAFGTFAAVGALLVFVGEALHKALERAHRAEKSNTLLLSEMGHRVKNNFAMILSLIGLQTRKASPETRAALEAIASRVRLISQVHDHLGERAGDILMSDYVAALSHALIDSVRELRPLSLTVDVSDGLLMRSEQALPIGFIINELITNTLKYAYEDAEIGHVGVRLLRTHEGLELSVVDDGRGCPETAEPGLGSRLVQLFAEQLGGTVTRRSLDPGCAVTVRFPQPTTRMRAAAL